MQSQVRFYRVPEKVPEKVLGIFGAKPSQIQRVPEKVPEKVQLSVSSAWFRSNLQKDL